MKVVHLILLSAIILFSAVNSQAADNTLTVWQGTYRFGGIFGKDPGGFTIRYNVDLTISPDGRCTVKQDGYQIMTRTDCKISKNGNGIDILVKNCSKDDLGPCGYEPGDRMLSLFPKGKGKILITDWGKLKPEGYVKTNRGVYMKRIIGK